MSELTRAKREVEESRLQLEVALNHLEEKISDGYKMVNTQVNTVVSTVKAPYVWASRNPLLNVAVFLTAGFVVGTRLRKTGKSGLNKDAEDSRDNLIPINTLADISATGPIPITDVHR